MKFASCLFPAAALAVLLAGLLAGPPARAQSYRGDVYMLKTGPLNAAFGGEYGLTAEKKVFERRRKASRSKKGYYQRKSILSGTDAKPRRESAWDATKNFLFDDYNKFVWLNAAYVRRDFPAENEMWQGPVVRFGIKRYFLERAAPYGCYAFTGVRYGLLFYRSYDDFLQTRESYLIHQPGLIPAIGWQQPFGPKDAFVADAFAGFEFTVPVYGGGGSQPPSLVPVRFYWGIQIGLFWYNKQRLFR